MPDITVSYKGSNIANISASGTTTLLTAGKYCEDNIDILYTKTIPEPDVIVSSSTWHLDANNNLVM